MKTVIGLIRSIHPFPVTVVLLLSALLLLVAHGGALPAGTFLRALGVVLLQQVSVGAFNDYVDRHDDALVQPYKPIPSGVVSAGAVLSLGIVSLLLLMPLAITFGAAAFALVISGTAGGLLYDFWLKPTPLAVAGYILGFLSLVTWIWLVAGALSWRFAIVYPAGAALLLAAHLAQSLPDIDSDRTLGHRGLAAVVGPAATVTIIFVSFSLIVSGGVGLALLASSRVGVVLLVPATLLVIAAAVVWVRSDGGRDARLRMFRLVAPGLALAALADLVALRALS
jgi:4-hydroxybenzoate polyprenyltransferase